MVLHNHSVYCAGSERAIAPGRKGYCAGRERAIGPGAKGLSRPRAIAPGAKGLRNSVDVSFGSFNFISLLVMWFYIVSFNNNAYRYWW